MSARESKVVFVKNTMGKTAKHALLTSRVWQLTIVMNRPWKEQDQVFRDFVDYANEKVRGFLEDQIFDTFMAESQDLVDRGYPKLETEVAGELNDKGFFHYHIVIRAIYPRIERENVTDASRGYLKRWEISLKDLQVQVRKAFGDDFPIPLKIHLGKGHPDSMYAMLAYNGKTVG